MFNTVYNTDKYFQVANVNIRSLNSCFDEFRDVVQHNNFDLIGVTETWLTEDFPTNYIHIPNYSLVRGDRPSRGGGVCIYIKSNYTHKLLNVSISNLEQLWIELVINQKRIGVGIIYKPPSVHYTALEQLEDTLSDIISEVDDIVLMGDMNIDMLKTRSVDTIYFQNLLNCFSLKQIVAVPTRITQKTSTLIDIICISQNISLVCIDTLDMLNLTDHCLVFCGIDIHKDKHIMQQFMYRNFNNFCHEDFQNDSILVDWSVIENISDINEKVTYLNDQVVKLFDKHAPLTSVAFKKPYRPWITYTIRQMITLKNKAFKRYLKYKTDVTYEYYRDLRNYVISAIRREKKAYLKFETDNNKNNPKKLWKCFNKLGIQSPTQFDIPEKLQNVHEINNYFSNTRNNVTVDINLINFYNSNLKTDGVCFSLHPVNSEEIYKSAIAIKTDALGADNISNKMLTIILPTIMNSLLNIINESFRTGCFPDIWKTAIVHPLPKIQNPTSFSDLRPISILPCMSKLIERIVHNRLMNYLNDHNLLPNIQSGFRKNYSTCSALTKVTDDICFGIDKSKLTILLLLDFSKAFDLINHELLLAKLHFFGLDSIAINWMYNYLKDRQQMVKLKSYISESKKLSCGVPQGSILAPLLFSIFTSDLPDRINSCSIHLYADDTQIYLSFAPSEINHAIARINNDLNVIVSWTDSNALKLNPIKSSAMLIGNERLRIKSLLLKTNAIILNATQLEFVDAAKNLGVIVDSSLSFEQHVNKKCSSAYMRLKTLYRYKHYLPSFTKYTISNTLIMSQFNYSITLYYAHLTSIYKKKIQKVQNSCIRFSFGIQRREHITPYLNEKKILNMGNRYVFFFLRQIYKILINQSPCYLYKLLEKRGSAHNLNLRHPHLLSIPAHSSSKFESSFSYLVPKLYNEYSTLFKLSYKVFTREIRNTLLEIQITEFTGLGRV